MKRAQFRASCLAVGLILACSTTVIAQARALPDLHPTEPVGWYLAPDGSKVLVTWAPTGVDLRLLDFTQPAFSPLRHAGEHYVWSPGEESPAREVRFLEARDGTIRGLEWRDARGAADTLPRAEEYPFDQERVRFTSNGDVLVGLRMVPRVRRLMGETGRPLREVDVEVPGAVIIHGSGSSDRDNVWAFTIAQSLARDGIAVLFPDKRGSGGSGGDWREADFEVLARDALTAAATLAEHPRVDASRIGFVGLSQGGWIAPLAATRGGAAFVVDVSGAAVTPGEQIVHEVTQDLRSAGLPDDAVASVLGLLDKANRYSRTLADSAWARYLAARQALAEAGLAEAVDPFPVARDHWQWSWWHEVIDFDPVPLWRELDAPALVVYGSEDEQDNVPVRESVTRLRPALEPERAGGNTIRVFEGSGHALVGPDTGWVRQDFLDLLSEWIIDQVGATRTATLEEGG